ncbi:ATP-dependent helicase [Oceanicella actignis]|uniref:ATP-dependent helicase n=1 Tax=Oceanicella actignis TaxID=1189325 RepID=UPI0011E6B939|nr:DNA helicase-2/ATP-dependent DNA helicase PcrA [Oceanicella actignis]
MSSSDFDEFDAFAGYEAQSLSARAMPGGPPGDAAYLDGLNPEQRAAVETLDGPVLVLAGAGTGKTRALTCRVAHLLRTGRARPNEIFAVTFTNKAAREMKERVGALVGGAVEGMPWLGTFHALCAKLLRRHAELAGLKPNFTILDTDDQLRLLKQLIAAENIDEKRWPPRMLAGLIDRWKNRGWTPANLPADEAAAFGGKGGRLYADYQERLRTLNAADFGDLLVHVLTIFQAHPEVLKLWRGRLRYILVDEYQDTNVAQYLLLRLLAAEHRNICCVGDDDQSIYGWRGAEVGNILRFEQDFPGAAVIRLERNYRSTPHILAVASEVIAANERRLGKTLWTDETEGEKVRLIGHWDGEEEARWIGEEIEALTRGTRGMEPVSPDGIAILVRASFQMRAFEDRFLNIGLPYRVIGGPRFYERLEIRDAMAYFRLAVSPDDGLAFERVMNRPKRGLGEKAAQSVNLIARERGLTLVDAARALVAEGGLTARARGALGRLLEAIDRWHEAVRAGADHVALAETILDESGYVDHWRNDRAPDSAGRVENLKELVKALEQFENLQGFLEHVALVMDNEQEDGAAKVSIMTLHAAKGLEFPVVFLPGWEDGLFPSQRSMDENGLAGLEEERRLAYVGLTRARRLAVVSFAANRAVFGRWQSALPSRFIDEMPPEHVEVLTPPGLHGGPRGRAAVAGGRGAAGADGRLRAIEGLAGVVRGSELEERAARAGAYDSPGWRRMQARRAAPSAAPVVIDARAAPAFALGERVFHQKFGYGAVQAIEGDKLTVDFEKAGVKKVVAGYVTAADDVPF